MEPAGQVVLLAVSLAFVNPVTAEINVALNKKASQSSLLRSEYPAERAVDGNTGTILYPLKECTHTDLEYEPWWKVDLGDTYVISHVTVINRGDCCGERLRNFMVRVGPYEDFRENTPCGDIYSETPSEGETIDVRCEEPISGRWVSVQLIGREDYLSLCEVQVFSGTDQPVAPSITHPPVDTTGVDGGVITLFCEANMKLNILWQKGGRTIIPDARNRYDVIEYHNGRASALRIDPLRSPRDNDTFTCRAESANDGSVVEASAAINILTEDSLPAGFPDINRQPQLKAVEKGRPTVLVCSASGDPAPDITWLKDMVPVDMADDRVKLLSSGSLQISSTREEDEGTYECVATNSLGTRYSYKANLYVRVRRVPPYFTITPEDVEVNRGDDVNLTCVAIGSPMPFVQWLKDYENVEEQTSQNGRNILQLENVVESANYTCAASSELGLIEHNAQVTVKVPISITHPPVDTTGVDGDVITLFCEANMKLNIEWRKGGRTIPSARNRYDVIEYQNRRASALRIDPLRSTRDNDTFTCNVENVNDGSVVEASASVNIMKEDSLPAGFPDITWQPQLKAVEKGRPTVLVCSASGDPAPDITWLKDMVPVDMADDRVKLLSSGSLQISSTREEDEGTYECVATNSLGTRYSYKANLYVRVRRVPPYFITTPENVEVNRGDDVNLTCVAIGSPMPFVQWLKEYENVEEQTSQNGRNILQLENVVESANYTCAASSELGLIEYNAEVTVKDTPPMVDGYTARRGGCPGNDIWIIYARSTTLEQCARECTIHPRCVAFQFFDNHECYPKSKSCEETVKTNPKNVLYDRIADTPPMVDGYTARRGGCPGNDIWIIYARSTTLEQCARECTIHPRCVAFQFFDNHECYPKSKSCEETVKTNPKNVLYDKIVDTPPMVDGYTARRGGCPGNDIWIIYARSTTLEQCARECTIHPRCVAFQFFDNHECYPKSKSCEETVKTNPKNVLYDRIVDTPPMVDGYTARRGGCPGNDIWIIYARSTTLEQCARECTIHPRCVAFQFFDNHECYPKSKSCEETVKTNPKNVLYDRIVEVDADSSGGSFKVQPAEPISPPGRSAAGLRSLQTDDLTESEADPEASGLVRKIFGLPIFRKRRHVPDQPDDS
ncbi:hemicentin-1-like isoform X3 [Branchiostoma floridae x Branchiostoma belcheri]